MFSYDIVEQRFTSSIGKNQKTLLKALFYQELLICSFSKTEIIQDEKIHLESISIFDKNFNNERIIKGLLLNDILSNYHCLAFDKFNHSKIDLLKKEVLWRMNFGYFSPTAFNTARTLCIMAEVPTVEKLKLIDLLGGKEIGIISIDEVNKSLKTQASKFIRSSGFWIKNNIYFQNDLGELILIDSNSFTPIKKIFSSQPNGQWGEYYHDTSRNKLVKFINKTIHEVDLDTHEIEFFEPARFKDKDAEPNGGKWAQDKTYIYYCSSDGTTVNALNKKTKEIDWQHQHNQNAEDIDIVNEVPVRYHSIQYHQGRLFVMDNKRSLHIFEEGDMPERIVLV